MEGERDLVSHFVERSDTLHKIALRYDMPPSDILAVNKLRTESLHPGQELFVYAERPKTPTRQEIDPSHPLPIQPAPGVSGIPPEGPTTTQNFKEHIASARDSLSTIALVYGMKVSELKRINNLESDQIREGQVIKVAVESPLAKTKASRLRSRSLDSRKVLRVYQTSALAAMRVPTGTIPYVVGSETTLEEIAERFDMPVSALLQLNSLRTTQVTQGQIVFVRDPAHHSVQNEDLRVADLETLPNGNARAIRKADQDFQKAPWSIPLSGVAEDGQRDGRPIILKSVGEIFDEFRRDGASYLYQVPLASKNITREPCRYLAPHSNRTVLGVVTLTPTELLFDPHPRDKAIMQYGMKDCQFRLDIVEISAPLVTKEEEVDHPGKGMALDFGIPGSKLRYLYLGVLASAGDDLSDLKSEFYLAMHTNRIEAFYCLLLEAVCSRKEAWEKRNEAAAAAPPTCSDDSALPNLLSSQRMYQNPAPLLDPSTILRPEGKQKLGLVTLRNHLPARYALRAWSLVYSTDEHGISLRTFYERASKWDCSLLFIETRRGEVLGGFASAPWEQNDHYFGCGESFLFKLSPTTEVYQWQEASNNHNFMLARADHLEMGGGGKPGVWVDDEMKEGYSGPSETFGNPCLAATDDFEIAAIEVWSFSSEVALD